MSVYRRIGPRPSHCTRLWRQIGSLPVQEFSTGVSVGGRCRPESSAVLHEYFKTMQESDRLRDIHDELSTNPGDDKASSSWLPLGETSEVILLVSACLFNLRARTLLVLTLEMPSKKYEAPSPVIFMDALSGLDNPRAFFSGCFSQNRAMQIVS